MYVTKLQARACRYMGLMNWDGRDFRVEMGPWRMATTQMTRAEGFLAEGME